MEGKFEKKAQEKNTRDKGKERDTKRRRKILRQGKESREQETHPCRGLLLLTSSLLLLGETKGPMLL
jgi:hypothetical protein